ncbi:hypothetical protein HPP92_000078 [Vanilla planifolia]|uniref:Uncharacterized protein n=1 Tax=Vanilla planifolia TaxID=51239 RepID=A0A835S0K6_VANPL|nr:hypothetical protein HPP92_000078 [Vanilla planifolia]
MRGFTVPAINRLILSVYELCREFPGKPLPRWKEPPEPARKSNSLRLSLLDLRAPAVAVFFSPIKPPLLMESDVSILVVVSVSQSIRTHQV